MNERQLAILTLLIKHPDYRIGDLEKVLSLSRRQINYALDQFNDLLLDNRIPQIQRSKAGDFYIPSEVVQLLTTNTSPDDNTSYFATEGERRDIILLYLMVASHFISLEHLIDWLGVSKTTLVKDMKNASNFANQYDLKVTYDRDEGYRILGGEQNLRILLNDLVVLWRDRLDKIVGLTCYLTIRDDDLIHFISGIEARLGVKFSAESFKTLVKLLSYSLARIQSGKVKDNEFFMNQVRQTQEYQVVKELISPEWISTSSDIEWIALLVLSADVYLKNQTLFDESLLKDHIAEMVHRFEVKTLITVDNPTQFIDRLYSHIRPAIYRIKYGLSVERYNVNALIQERKHSILLSLIEELIKPLEQAIGIQFPKAELQLLSLYFGAQLEQKNQLLEDMKPKAVTVCANGLITSSMLKIGLENLFPEFVFLSAISEREFYDYQADYDVVFTTTLLDTQIQQFLVSPMMSNEEQLRLRYNVMREMEGMSKTSVELESLLKQIIDQVENHTIIRDQAALEQSLKNLLLNMGQHNSTSNYGMNIGLMDYLQTHFIQHTGQSMSWREAIIFAAQPMLNVRYINQSYVERVTEMMATTDYMYLGQSMAIPHAISDGDIYHDGISLLVSEKPIQFPGKEHVHVVVVLAIKDTTKHLKAMNQLSELALNQELVQLMITARESKIYEIIQKLE